jgi:HSP20 family protein
MTDAAPRGFDRLRDRLLCDLDRWPDLVRESQRPSAPATTVEETAGGWVVAVDVPGVRPEDLSVEVDGGLLVVDARRRWSERAGVDPGPRGRSRVELTLPGDVDAEAVTAALDDGVLRVALPRAAAAERRRIEVEHRERPR